MATDNLHGPIPKIEAHNTVRGFKEKEGRYRLVGVKCQECGEIYFPRRFVCPKCQSQKLVAYECAHEGVVITSWVDKMGFPAIGYEDIDNRVIAMIRLNDGVTIISEIVDVGKEVPKDTPVEFIIRAQKRDDTGNLVYGYKFRVCE